MIGVPPSDERLQVALGLRLFVDVLKPLLERQGLEIVQFRLAPFLPDAIAEAQIRRRSRISEFVLVCRAIPWSAILDF